MNIARRVPLVRNLDLVNETQVKQLPRLISLPLLQHDTPHSRLPHPQLHINVVGQRHFSAASLNPSSQLSSRTLRQTFQQSPLHTRTVTRSSLQRFYSTPSKMSFSNANTGSKEADPYKAKNQEEPGTKEKIEDLIAFIERSKFGMMTTTSQGSGRLASRCMALAGTENGGIDLIFHTNTESGKTDDLEANPSINMSFYNATGEWASLSGDASIITDRAMVSKHYSPSLKAWLGDLGDGKHDGSENDPRIGLIKISAKTATYATSRSNAISRGIEMVQGAITGSAAQVNKLREITEEELSSWRSSH